jgi:hypothetical protein
VSQVPDKDNNTRSETDKVLSDRARGPAERAVLGDSPTGSIIRLVVFVVVFIVLAGTVFYFLAR